MKSATKYQRLANGYIVAVLTACIAIYGAYHTFSRFSVKQENLNVTYKNYAYGRATLNGLYAGEIDVAHCFDMPEADDALAGKPLRIIGTLIRSNQNQTVIGRRDLGIGSAADLAGKRVGLVPGTSTDYLLFLLLKETNVAPSTIRRIAMKPDQAVDLLVKGDVDAVATWQLHVANVQAAMPDKSLIVMRSNAYTELSMLLIRADTNKDEALHRLMRALVKAEDYLVQHPAEAEALVVAWLNEQPAEIIRQGWKHYRHQLRLDNLLLTTLNNEAAWLAAQKKPAPALPDFTKLLAPQYLAAARSQSVTVRLP